MLQRKAGSGPAAGPDVERAPGPAVGKRSLVEQAAPAPTPGGSPGKAVAKIASRGVAGGGGPLPHGDQIQASFGRHDISHVTSHQDPASSQAAGALGATAYAFGDSVAFASSPDVHTAAHEAAHVVQQRGGVQLKGGIDQPGDAHERHADAVADAVVAGASAEPLLDQVATGASPGAVVQRSPGPSTIATPTAGINKTGFIDTGDGANIRTGPEELGGQPLTDQPLPPATRVYVSGTHPQAPQWWYVSAYAGSTMMRGYVQDLRITTDLPEATAELHQIVAGDTAEGLAARKFSGAVSDGHDLRYYENVLLYVNQQKGRVGITGSYQDPGITGGGSNNIQLVADHRIWLVSAAYARALQAVVPSGSLTGGAVAKLKRFGGHLEDILRAVNESPSHFGEVAGEYAKMISDHAPEILGTVALFLTAEALSIELAATPAGVTQIAALVIQLLLTWFGAQGLVMASLEAAQHGASWISLGFNANGDPAQIAAASKEFLKMLVSIAIAVLAFLGMKGNAQNALEIASNITPPPSLMPATALANGGSGSGAGAAVQTGVAIGPNPGAAGVGGAMMMNGDKDHPTSGGENQPPRQFRLTPETVDSAVSDMKASGRLTGDLTRLDKVIKDAKLGQDGALGELEALQRWIAEGRQVEVLGETNNATGASGDPIRNPDYRVDGTLTEIKSRSQQLNSRWIKDQITDASDQVEKSIQQSGKTELGNAELQLRGPDATAASFNDVERQVLGSFNANRGTNLSRVTVLKDGVKFAEWVRQLDGTVVRVFPP